MATASLVAVIYALVDADTAGWVSAQTLGLLAAAGIAGFVAVESRVGEPLVPVALLRRRATVTALVLMMLGMGTLVSRIRLSAGSWGHSALRTGGEFLPVAVAIVVAAHAGGRLIMSLGRNQSSPPA